MSNAKIASPFVAKSVSSAITGKTSPTSIAHVGVGKVSFEPEKINENAKALIDAVLKAKPTTAKGKYVKKINVASTMGPGVLVDAASIGA